MLAALFSTVFSQQPQADDGDKPMNFLPEPVNAGISIQCLAPGDSGCMRGTVVDGDPDTTPFLIEWVYIDDGHDDPDSWDNGPTLNLYQHMIIGIDPGNGDGFVQETYIRSIYTGDAANQTEYAAGSTADAVVLGANIDASFLGQSSSGNASGNPNRVLVRQKLNSGDLRADFTKKFFTQKPLIEQTVTSLVDGMVSIFSLDMGNSDYSTSSADAIMQNKLTFEFAEQGEFSLDMYDTADINIDGGKYTYSSGTGLFDSEGTYNYSESGIDLENFDWTVFDDGSNY